MVKTITIRDEVYEKLASAKDSKESFSEFLNRLVESTNAMETLRKLRGTLSLPEKKKILQEIAQKRTERRT
jgi:predicted CopG family antitoxin